MRSWNSSGVWKRPAGPTAREKALLDEAQAAYEANPSAGVPWSEVEARLHPTEASSHPASGSTNDYHPASGLPLTPEISNLPLVKASELIAEIKGLSPEGYAEVSAFILSAEREDPALRTALQRKQTSTTGQVVSRPYEQVQASVRASLHPAR